MNTSYRFWNRLGLLLFILGFLIGMVFISLTVWSDLEGNAFWGIMEAATFDRQAEMEAQLKGITCPQLITRQETGTVTVRLANPLDQPVDVILQTDISVPGPVIEPYREVQEFQLDPLERRELSWTVGMENLKFNRLILVRTYLIDTTMRVPARTAHCGILVVDSSVFSSSQIILISVALSLSGMVLGILLWVFGQIPLKDRLPTFSMAALAGVTLAGIVATLTGLWVVAGGFIILNLIILFTLLEHSVHRI